MRELERTDAKLARWREERARLDADIATAEKDREEQVLAKLKQAGVGRLPPAALETLVQSIREAEQGQAPVSYRESDAQEDRVEVRVRLSANASKDKQGALRAAGLRWNGKAGRWIGKVPRDMLESLSKRFGDRVETAIAEAPPTADGAPPCTAVATVEAPPVAADEPFPGPEPHAPFEGAPSPSWTSPSRLPLRRPLAT